MYREISLLEKHCYQKKKNDLLINMVCKCTILIKSIIKPRARVNRSDYLFFGALRGNEKVETRASSWEGLWETCTEERLVCPLLSFLGKRMSTVVISVRVFVPYALGVDHSLRTAASTMFSSSPVHYSFIIILGIHVTAMHNHSQYHTACIINNKWCSTL